MTQTPHTAPSSGIGTQLSFLDASTGAFPAMRPSPTAPTARTRRVPVRAHERTVRPTNPTTKPSTSSARPSPTRATNATDGFSAAHSPKRYTRADASTTSHQAADSLSDAHLSTQEEIVYRCFLTRDTGQYPQGLTDQELIALTGIGQSARPRRIALTEPARRLLVDSGDRRLTESGRQAVVWRMATREERDALPYPGGEGATA